MKPDELVEKLLEADEDIDPDQYVERMPAYQVAYLIFPAGNRAYGGGGWSRHAKHRPLPQTVRKQTNDVKFKGKSVVVDGVRRLKVNVWAFNGDPLHIDYPDLKYEPA